MIVIVVVMACAILLDGLLLLSDPSLYRRCMEYVEEVMGVAWMIASAFAFMAPGLAFLIHAPFSTAPILSAIVGCVCVVIGLFFALATTERFGYLAKWWRCRSNTEYRIAGLAVIGLCVWMLLLAFELPRP
jgi:hypothetical protein